MVRPRSYTNPPPPRINARQARRFYLWLSVALFVIAWVVGWLAVEVSAYPDRDVRGLVLFMLIASFVASWFMQIGARSIQPSGWAQKHPSDPPIMNTRQRALGFVLSGYALLVIGVTLAFVGPQLDVEHFSHNPYLTNGYEGHFIWRFVFAGIFITVGFVMMLQALRISFKTWAWVTLLSVVVVALCLPLAWAIVQVVLTVLNAAAGG